MSSEVWAMGMLRKHQLAVDFCLNFVEDDWADRYYFGEGRAHATFEDALQYAVTIVTGRKGG